MALSFRELLEETRARVREVDVAALATELASPTPPLVLDVREGEEAHAGVIPGARALPRGFLELRIEAVAPRDQAIVVYCAAGTRSALAARTLGELGYTDVRSLAGGFRAWRASGAPVEVAPVFTADQRARYSRHILLDEIGERGQAKLRASRILVHGLGPTGSALAAYLAAAGVGRLALVDDALVGEPAAEAGFLHPVASRASSRAASAEVELRALNPDVDAFALPCARVREAGDSDLIIGADLGDDALAEHVAATHSRGTPLLLARAGAGEGVIAVLEGGSAPCPRCVVAAFAPRAPSTAATSAVVPSVVGALAATLAAQRLLGEAWRDPRIIHHDGRTGRFEDTLLGSGEGCDHVGLDPQPVGGRP